MNKSMSQRSQRLWVIISLILLLTILVFIGANLSTNQNLVQNAQAALGGGEVTLTVNAANQVGTFSDDMLGVGYANWEHAWGKPFLGTEKTEMITNAMKEIRPGIIRYAGGNWTNAVGWSRIPQVRPNFVNNQPQPINIQHPWTNDSSAYLYHYGTNEIDSLAAYEKSN